MNKPYYEHDVSKQLLSVIILFNAIYLGRRELSLLLIPTLLVFSLVLMIGGIRTVRDVSSRGDTL